MQRARDNPFAVHRVLAERYRLDEAGWTQLLARLNAQGGRGAIVGPHGSGKTTLLEDLAERLEGHGARVVMLRFNSTERRLGVGRAYASGEFVLVDGAEQLSWLDWMRLRLRARRADGLVITAHAEGKLPTLHRCATSPELLSELTQALGEPMAASESAALHERHTGNVRESFWELYDRWASAKPPRSCCITGVALQMEEQAEAERRAARKGASG